MDNDSMDISITVTQSWGLYFIHGQTVTCTCTVHVLPLDSFTVKHSLVLQSKPDTAVACISGDSASAWQMFQILNILLCGPNYYYNYSFLEIIIIVFIETF